MSSRIEPTTHIDIRVVKNLLKNRIDEGRELMKSAALPNSWKKIEQARQEKLRMAMRNIEDAINVEEGNKNDASENKASEESNSENR